MEGLDSTVGVVALVTLGLALIACGVAVWSLRRLRALQASQSVLFGEGEPRDLIGHAADLERLVEELQTGVDQVSKILFERLDQLELQLRGTVAGTAVVRYDALNESTGRQSSTIALLDREANGVVISAILQREQARVYAKQIDDGASELELSPEEREALTEARARIGRTS